MPKKLKSIVKQTANGVLGGTMGAALGPAIPVASIGGSGSYGACFLSVCWTTLVPAVFALTLVPGAFYGFIRGVQIGSCDIGGVKKVPKELFNHRHDKSRRQL